MVAVVLSHINIQVLRTLNIDLEFALKENYIVVLFIQFGSAIKIFFAISGFILAYQFYLNKTSLNIWLKQFYLKRLIKIILPYQIVLLVLFIVQVFLNRLDNPFSHYLASVLFIHNYYFDSISTINPVAWTLEIELQFYFLLPIFLWWKQKKNEILLLLIALVVICIFLNACYQSVLEHFRLTKSILPYCSIFIVGIIAAILHQQDKFTVSLPKTVLLFGLLICIYISIAFAGYTSVIYQFFYHINMLVLILLALKLDKNYHSNQLLVYKIGKYSYAIYLWHYAIIFVLSLSLHKMLFHFSYFELMILLTLIAFPFIYFFAAFMHFIINRFFVQPLLHRFNL